MAALAFRVGAADETLANRGITHFVEHVALSSMGRREYVFNGCVDAATTIFYAEGERDEVFEFLRIVGAALQELPEDRVELERRVLRAEAEHHEPGVVARMLDFRFGAAGYGLANYGELGLRWLRASDLRAYSAERFTRQNAISFMTGEPPDDLGLALPDGVRMAQRVPEPLALELPAYVAQGYGGVGLSGLGARSTALRVAMALAGERLYDRVRAREGLAYAPAGGYSSLDAGVGHAFIGSDCRDEHAPAVLEALWRVVNELADDGATPEELERHRRLGRRAVNDPDHKRGRVSYEALGELTGDPVLSDEQALAELEAVGAADVAAAMDEVRRSAILLGPQSCPPPDRELHELEARDPAPVTEGEEFVVKGARKRLIGRREGGSVLRVGERGVTLEPDGEPPATIEWARCEAAIRLPAGDLVLHQRDGRWLQLPPDGWDRDPIEAVAARVPAGRTVPDCDQALFERITDLAGEFVPPGAAGRALVNDVPAAVGGDELRELVTAYQRLTLGLLLVTDRRVVFLTHKEDKAFEVALECLTNAYGDADTLELYWEGGSAKLQIEPKRMATHLGTLLRESRTEPVR